MKASEMTNVQIADYILSLQSDVDGFPFNSNEIIKEAAKRLLTDGDDDISKDAEIAELRCRLKVAEKFAAKMKESTNSLVRACGHQMILRLQGEGVEDGDEK